MSDLLSKFIMKKKTEDVIHSSAYAEAQNSGGIGAASTQSFSDRMKIEKDRSRIRGYNDSRLVSQARALSGIKAKTYEAPERKDGFLDRKSQTNASFAKKPNGASGLSRPPVVRNPGISKKI